MKKVEYTLSPSLEESVPVAVLKAEVGTWARRMGLEARLQEIYIRPMKRKWASVSSRGRLTLNRDLLTQPAAFRREVIIHELVHLKLNHGGHNKMFRSLVRAYLAEPTDL